mmetsp:Transcript_138369/g.240807  ORF Transcript_138369/g.240807 Transcript_138369/m.240807 type:complete len:127 (+) Transcript_138369:78-458(+)
MAAEDPEKAAQKQAAEMALRFNEKAAAVREYLDTYYSGPVREGLKTLATERPADPKSALSQVWRGKKSLGEIGKEPKTTDPALRTAAPRQYLQSTVSPALAGGLAKCFLDQPRRPVSELGDILNNR